jgi:hypothetical protein
MVNEISSGFNDKPLYVRNNLNILIEKIKSALATFNF